MSQTSCSDKGTGWVWVDQLRQDVHYSLRQLRKAPAFTLTATLTLAIGIGATTAIFTLIHAVLLKSLPVVRPEQLYTLGEAKHVGQYTGSEVDWDIFSYDLYTYLRDLTDGFQELAAFQGDPRRVGVRRTGDPRSAESMIAEYVSGNYFSMFGVPAFGGRAITPEDDHAGAPPVAMMGYRAWQEKYASDPSVLGASFALNGTPVTIVGVAPPGFFGDALRGNPPDFWIPLAAEPAVGRAGLVNTPQLHGLYLMGRIKPGAEPAAIEAQMQVELQQWLTGRLPTQAAAQIPHQTLHLRPGGSGIGLMRAPYPTGLELLMGISAFVLLIVCANVANLILVRGLARRRQTSIGLALGASRARLVRQALTESITLALIGGSAGVVLAFAGTRSLISPVFAGGSAAPMSATPDLAVLAFAFASSLLSGVVFGIAPAWSANRADPIDALRAGSRLITTGRSLVQRALAVTQAALSLALLVASGLLAESL